ncbi:urea ABC transporter ATP-binding subunit UrtE [Nocardia sp. NPDC052254]|uniref:urea ABC transporter ATP-binding subunit UrtE n=1 Tax=Nocardia sp. NPDC052254 TaxID=3155681 RepID=UPI0034207F44
MLTLTTVCAGYGRSRIVHDIDLEVARHSVTAVLGHNGAGKSTLLKTVVGLLPAQAGTIELDGLDITRLRPHQRVRHGLAYVPQGQRSFAQLTTRENLLVVAERRVRAGRATTSRTAVDATLDLFPALRDLLDRPAGLLSGGQRQQLAIARALLTEPKLLILDEPTEGIQPNVVAEIESAITQLTSNNTLSALLVEQHIGFALNSAQRYHVLQAGRIVASGAGGREAEAAVRQAITI